MEFGNRQKYFVEMVFIRVVSFGEHRFRQGIMVFWEAEIGFGEFLLKILPMHVPIS